MLFCFRVQKNKRRVRSRRGNPPLVALSAATKTHIPVFKKTTRIHPVGVVHERCAERRKIWGPGEHSLAFDAYGDCGGLSSLSNDSETETNPVSAIETESFQSLEELLGNPSVSSLTDAEQASVDALSEEAYQAQSDGDMAKAVLAMEKVLAIDPTHPTANFVLGINDINTLLLNSETRADINRVIALVTDQRALFDTSGGQSVLSGVDQALVGVVNNVLFVTSTQNMVLQDVFQKLEAHMPVLNAAIVRLQRVLRHSQLDYHVVSDTFALDYRLNRLDVLGLYAGLNLVRSLLDMGLSYDYRFKEGQYVSTEDWLSKNPNFLTLRPDGVRRMANAGMGLRNAITAVIAAKEEADRSPDLGRISGADLAHAIPVLEKIRRSLKGETVRVLFSVINNAKTERVEHTLAVNLGNFFNSPISDFRHYLGVHMKGPLNASSFPTGFDFTLGGLFPELKAYADWQTYNSFGLVLYNDDGAMGDGSLNAYSGTIKKSGDVLVVLGGDAYGDRSVAAVFRVSDHGVVGSLGKIAGTGSSGYWRDRHTIALSAQWLYHANTDKLSVYSTDGSAIAKVHALSLSSSALDMHVYQDRLYVITASGIDRYSLADPTRPTFLGSTGFEYPLSGYDQISFEDGKMAFLKRVWGFSNSNGYFYTTTVAHYDLVSGGRTSVANYQTGYYAYSGYVNGTFVAVLSRKDYSGYDIRWSSGETAVVAGEFAGVAFNDGFLGLGRYSSNIGFDVYDLRTPGTAKHVGDYKPFSGGNPEILLPTEVGVLFLGITPPGVTWGALRFIPQGGVPEIAPLVSSSFWMGYTYHTATDLDTDAVKIEDHAAQWAMGWQGQIASVDIAAQGFWGRQDGRWTYREGDDVGTLRQDQVSRGGHVEVREYWGRLSLGMTHVLSGDQDLWMPSYTALLRPISWWAWGYFSEEEVFYGVVHGGSVGGEMSAYAMYPHTRTDGVLSELALYGVTVNYRMGGCP